MPITATFLAGDQSGPDDALHHPNTASRPAFPSAGQAPLASFGEGFFGGDRRVERAIVAFVVLGVLLRVAHFLANYPLWGDEAFLALSFVRRGYLDLLRPLEYGQISPILFLGAELTAVKMFGFSEMSLRLCPLLCGITSVFLFRRVAGRVLNGTAVLMAVAIFAVSIHPIRHSADTKPYASDLLVALGFLALAIEWHRSPRRTAWLWALVAYVPLALAASYPAVLVAGGVGLSLAPSVWRTRRRGPFIALIAYATATAFAVVLCGTLRRHQGTGVLLALQSYWADSFPPLDSALRLVKWLITTHAGSMFAYPGGGNRGASAFTLILVLIGAVIYWRRRQRTILSLLVMPMPVALVAAAFKLYPYGGQARVMQYLGPAICLLAGSGVSGLLYSLPRGKVRAAAAGSAVVTLAIAGLALLVEDFRHPYRAIYDHHSREFARRFWPEQARRAELACLSWDFGIRRPHNAGVRTALYLCNQHIYSPSRRRGAAPNLGIVTSERPLRCMAFDNGILERPEAIAWLETMNKQFILRERSEVISAAPGSHGKPRVDHITVFEFEPRPNQATAQLGDEIANDRARR